MKKVNSIYSILLILLLTDCVWTGWTEPIQLDSEQELLGTRPTLLLTSDGAAWCGWFSSTSSGRCAKLVKIHETYPEIPIRFWDEREHITSLDSYLCSDGSVLLFTTLGPPDSDTLLFAKVGVCDTSEWLLRITGSYNAQNIKIIEDRFPVLRLAWTYYSYFGVATTKFEYGVGCDEIETIMTGGYQLAGLFNHGDSVQFVLTNDSEEVIYISYIDTIYATDCLGDLWPTYFTRLGCHKCTYGNYVFCDIHPDPYPEMVLGLSFYALDSYPVHVRLDSIITGLHPNLAPSIVVTDTAIFVAWTKSLDYFGNPGEKLYIGIFKFPDLWSFEECLFDDIEFNRISYPNIQIDSTGNLWIAFFAVSEDSTRNTIWVIHQTDTVDYIDSPYETAGNAVTFYNNSSFLVLRFEEQERRFIEIFDILGRKLETLESNGNSIEISTKGFSSGVYTIRVNSKSKQPTILKTIVIK